MGICVCNEEQRKYFIAVATSQDNPEFEEYTIPATIWAIFPGIGTNKWLLCLADKKAELPRKHINIFWKVRLLCYVPGRIRTAGLPLRRIEHAFSSPLICVNPSQTKSRIKSTFESISVNLNIISVSLRQPVNISKMFATANNSVEGHCQWPGIRSAIMPDIRE